MILISSVIFLSCKKEFDDPNWDVDLLAPLMKSTLTIDEIIADSIRSEASDNSVSLIYQEEIYRFNLDSLYGIPDTSVEYTAKLSNLDLGVIEVSIRKSLGDIAIYDSIDNGATGGLYELIMVGHNTGNPTAISSIAQQVYDNLEVDATGYFQTAVIQSGYIDIEFDNGMPIPFSNVMLELKNQSNGQIIIQDTFPFIPAFTNVMHTKSLAGLTVYGNMVGTVMFESPGSSGDVTVDTNMAMIATIRVRDLSIESATAIFPTQNIVDQGGTSSFTVNDIQLSEALIKEGNVSILVYNTIEEPLQYYFKIPSATQGGSQLELNGTVPAAIGGNPGYINIYRDLAGYFLNFRGIGPIEQISGDLNNNGYVDADTINTLYYELTGRIDSSGNLISLSLDDSVYVRLAFSDLIPFYAKGYLGQESVSVSGTQEIDLFKDILGGTIDIEDVKLSITVSNQIGVEGGIFLNNFATFNSKTGAGATLQVPPVYNPFIINKPVDPMSTAVAVTPVYSTMYLDKTNSNPDELIEIMPDRVDYTLDFMVNPNTPPPAPGTGTDFIYYDTEAIVTLDVEMPLSLIASNITLINTAGFKITEKDVERINGGSLILYADNQFPLEAEIQLYLLDDIGNVIDSLLPMHTKVDAGYYNSSTGRVDEKKRSKISIPVTKDRLGDLVLTKDIRIIVRFTTNPYQEFVKIYNYYSIDFKLIGDFSYHIN
ncbi:MAG: hypothetical protein ABIJ16_06505 [Bacteroidota bacterium]